MRVTKAMLIEEIQAVMEEYQKVSETLLELMQKEEIRYGEYLIHSMYHNFHYKSFYGMIDGQKTMLYGTGRKKTKVWTYEYTLRKLKESLAEARELTSQK